MSLMSEGVRSLLIQFKCYKYGDRGVRSTSGGSKGVIAGLWQTAASLTIGEPQLA